MSKTIQSTEEAGTASERRPAVVKKGTHTRRGSARRKGSRTRASADRRKAGRRKKAGRTGFSGSLLIQNDRQNLISMVLAVTVVVLILAALITPADPLSMFVLAIPLYGLYEFSITQCKNPVLEKEEDEE